jgi:hypothetical protein
LNDTTDFTSLLIEIDQAEQSRPPRQRIAWD